MFKKNIYLIIYIFINNLDAIKIIDNKKISILNCIKNILPKNPIILEAGAYNGSDTLLMKLYWPNSKIYAFEPVPKFFKMLEKTTLECKNVFRYQLALGEVNKKEKFNLANHVDSKVDWPSGSLLKPKEHLQKAAYVEFNSEIEVDVVNLDWWTKENNINYIDFIWLDLQGYEYEVLKNSPNILNNTSIIYTEVEFIEAYENQKKYNDIVELLRKFNFIEYARDFTKESINKERWYGNVIFIKKNLL